MEPTIKQALQQGVAAHKEGRLQDAERLYRAILQSQPTHPDANHNLGVLAVSVNKAEAALPLFKTALDANPKIKQFWLSYVDALIKEKQFENAKQVLEQAKTQGVAEEKLNVLEAQLTTTAQVNEPKLAVQKKNLSFSEKRKKLAEQKKQKKAKKQNFKAISPSESEIKNLLEHYQNGRYDDTEELAKSITQQFPEHQFAWAVLGSVLRQTGRLIDSLTALRKSVKLEPQDASAHSNLSITLQELGRLDEAEAGYTQAIALKPDFAEAHYNLGITLQELGRLDEAEASYNQAIALRADFAQAHSNLGVTLQKLGRLDEALASYTQAIALKPDYAAALKDRGLLLFDKKEFESALRDADLCNSKDAIQFDMTSLYALGRIEEIYKRIENKSKTDSENISIAAFAAFISEAMEKPTAYNFCPNPIDFIHVANLSSHVNDTAAYVAEIIEELNKVETVWEPTGKSTVSGFQTPPRENLFESPSKKINQLKSIIINEIEAYYLKFQNEQCSYIQKFPTTRNLFGWTVTLKQQGHQNAHIHVSGWLSGVIYLKVVPSLGKDEGAIEFCLNGARYSNINSPNLTHHPEVGDIVFFPSSLHHRTIPFTTDADRIIFSFDLRPEVAKS